MKAKPEEIELKQFSRLYPSLVGMGTKVSEPREAEPAIREKLIRCLWFDQFLDSADLRTTDGEAVKVHWPGHWNEGPGPDFMNAEITFGGGPRKRGDVEIHILSSGWKAHGHDGDTAYDKVILHVVLDNDPKKAQLVHNGRAIPQLALREHLSADVAEAMGSLDTAAYPAAGCGREGLCARSIRAMGRDEKWVGRFLDIAGDERMLRKASQFAVKFERMTPDEALYEALMDAMGYKANRRGFRLLAERMPLKTLKRFTPTDATPGDRLAHVQGMLFGAAGFLDGAGVRSLSDVRAPDPLAADRETADNLAELRAIWGRVQHEIGVSAMDAAAWTRRGLRPVNYPPRRLAGISGFLAAHLHSGLCRAMMSATEATPAAGSERSRCKETVRQFQQMLEGAPQTYWARRYGFGPETSAKPAVLIGASRTTEVIVNVVVPLLLALSQREKRSRLEQRLHNVYSMIAPLPDNSVTSRMKNHMFPQESDADAVVRSARRQQGLLQVYRDFCESESATCRDCGFLAAVERSEA